MCEQSYDLWQNFNIKTEKFYTITCHSNLCLPPLVFIFSVRSHSNNTPASSSAGYYGTNFPWNALTGTLRGSRLWISLRLLGMFMWTIWDKSDDYSGQSPSDIRRFINPAEKKSNICFCPISTSKSLNILKNSSSNVFSRWCSLWFKIYLQTASRCERLYENAP